MAQRTDALLLETAAKHTQLVVALTALLFSQVPHAAAPL